MLDYQEVARTSLTTYNGTLRYWYVPYGPDCRLVEIDSRLLSEKGRNYLEVARALRCATKL